MLVVCAVSLIAVRVQMEWLKENGFGGIMVWSIDMDDFSGKCGNGKYPLLRSLSDELKGYKVSLEYDGPYETHGPRGAYTTKDRKCTLFVVLRARQMSESFVDVCACVLFHCKQRTR